MTLGVTGGAAGFAEVVGLDVAHRTPRSESVHGALVAAALEPIVSAIAIAVYEMLSEIPAGLAEDVVRGKVRLAGGGSLLPGLASRIETTAGIGAVLVEDPLRCVIRGAAEMLERKEPGQERQGQARGTGATGVAPIRSAGWVGGRATPRSV